MNILLTSAGRRSYLVRYFKEAVGSSGIVAAGNSIDCPAFREADRAILTPLVYSDDYIPFLLDYCESTNTELIIPLLDIDIPVLAKNKSLFFERGITVVVPDYEVALICNDKFKTAGLLKSNGINTPNTYLRIDDCIKAVQSCEVHYPLVVKPRWGMGSIGVLRVETEKELIAAFEIVQREISNTYLRYESDQSEESVIIQQCLSGIEYGLDVMCDLSNRYRGLSVKQKIAMRAGETDAARTVHLPAAELLGEKLASIIPHPGNLDVDAFLVDESFFVLELNARFGGGYPFSHAAGVDLPKAIVEWKRGNDISDAVLTPQPNIYAYKELTIRTVKNG